MQHDTQLYLTVPRSFCTSVLTTLTYSKLIPSPLIFDIIQQSATEEAN